MKRILPLIAIVTLLLSSCTSQKKLAYLNNVPETGGEQTFAMDLPQYRLQSRDIILVTIKAMSADGRIADFLSTGSTTSTSQDESGGYLSGYIVNPDGDILIPAVGRISVKGLTLEEARVTIQTFADKVFKNSTVDCKLQSYKFTVIGEVVNPGTYINYSSFLTVFEAIGKAGGVNDYGNRYEILVIRPIPNGTKAFNLNLQDKKILTSEAYFLLPNDVLIVKPRDHKIFNDNLPTISFIISTLTSTISTTLLLILFFRQ